MIVAAVVGAGVYYLLLIHAATPYSSIETEVGTLAGSASIVAPNAASNTKAVQFGALVSPVAVTPMLGAVEPADSDAALYAAGFREVVISVGWSDIEPAEGSYSSSAISSAQSEINAAIAAGLRPSLDIGVQYAPSWIFNVGAGTQFEDQYGDVFTGSADSGNYVPNAVTDMNVRAQLGDYLAYLGTHLTGLDSVRLGGAADNELRYPSGTVGSQGNAFWFYDTSSQATLPVSVQGWKPGTGTVAQATTFLNAYNAALVNYGVWLEQTSAAAFPAKVKLEILLPGWGERPAELSSAANNLLNAAPDELNEGLDWADLLPKLRADGRTVAYTTWADSTNGDSNNPDPAAYIHSILPTGMLEGGESTGNGQSTTTGMDLEFQDAKTWNWYVANWFFNGQSQTLQQLDSAFNAE